MKNSAKCASQWECLSQIRLCLAIMPILISHHK
jgi:hypothetical protein